MPILDRLTVHALILALKDSDRTVRQDAADALAAMGERAVEAIPALASALKDTDPGCREAARKALAVVQPQSAGRNQAA